MAENWAAVSREINARVATLGLRQKELAERSGVSPAIIREIQQGRIQRRRNPRTLEALSVALKLHPEHLSAVLAGQRPPDTGQAPVPAPDPVLVALDTIIREIRGLRAQIGTLSGRLDAVAGENGTNKKTRQP